jgi:hypothetical protein
MRYSQDIVYTAMAEVLIAINPWHELGIYSMAKIAEYQTLGFGSESSGLAAASLRQAPPHVFSVSARAYAFMAQNVVKLIQESMLEQRRTTERGSSPFPVASAGAASTPPHSPLPPPIPPKRLPAAAAAFASAAVSASSSSLNCRKQSKTSQASSAAASSSTSTVSSLPSNPFAPQPIIANCSIVVCGESGSGKTESAKMLLRWLATVTSNNAKSASLVVICV